MQNIQQSTHFLSLAYIVSIFFHILDFQDCVLAESRVRLKAGATRCESYCISQ